METSIGTNDWGMVDHMVALREEVEQDYADRMEELRNMYSSEMGLQTENYEKERDKFRMLESSLSETLKVKRQEADEFRTKADSFESKVEELAQRLENQTAEVIRLTLELEEYEYKDFGTANNSNHNKDDDEEEEGDSDYEYVDDGKDPA